MSNNKSFLSGLGMLGSAFAVAAALTLLPANLEAQCSGCRYIGGGQAVCGDPEVEDRCDGASSGYCSPCGWAYAAVPAQLTADGGLYTPGSQSFDALAVAGEYLSAGVTVMRNACSGAITGRHYTEEAAVRAREVTSALVFE